MKYMYVMVRPNYSDGYPKGSIEYWTADMAKKIYTTNYPDGGWWDESVPVWGNYLKWI